MKTFEDIAKEVGQLVTKKNEAYGDSFRTSGEILKLLYPNGAHPEQYRDMLATVRVLDKLSRIATDKAALGEDPWRGILGYAILAVHADMRDG